VCATGYEYLYTYDFKGTKKGCNCLNINTENSIKYKIEKKIYSVQCNSN